MRAQMARVDAVLVQAVIAAALSFAHLHDIASAAGQDGWKAWAYPISVDLLLVAAWRRLRTGDAKAAGWCWFVIALTASLGANVATAGLLDMDQVPAWLRILVAGWPAVAFLGGTLLAHSAPTTDELVVDQEDDAEPVPEPPIADPAPAVSVPAALVEHARKVAAEHQTRTGAVIDTPTLRARLGVPVPIAEAIAAQL
ncbi:DUF2637 domain-containing protein [Streptomyces sp. NBC_00243]|uniref:DUF2637 domain-containing protein n=1 Tax=Streptomyces sp. NBC_00243 TaxID=2975688 RepID=UPI002DDA69A0|nr:DUF2637 domain-containing protein [Streptomyces sp. NBC_00243]WRZ21403.1 DUF2637 domain-containing protein [Streptomyces sp. NBC_00243]